MFTSGSFKRYIAGQVVLSGTSQIDLVVNDIEPDSFVTISLNTVGGTIQGQAYISNIDYDTNTITVRGTSAGDTSTYDVFVLV